MFKRLRAFWHGFIVGLRGPKTVEEVVYGIALADQESARLVDEWLAAQQQREERLLAEYLRQASCSAQYQRGEPMYFN